MIHLTTLRHSTIDPKQIKWTDLKSRRERVREPEQDTRTRPNVFPRCFCVW